MKKTCLFLISLILSTAIAPLSTQGQWLYDTQYPPLKWRLIQTAHFDILFADSSQKQAYYFHKTLNRKYQGIFSPYGIQSARWPLILNAKKSNHNGYVSLAPRKSELFLCPPFQEFDGEMKGQWRETIITHEARHMAQFEYLDRGFTRFMSFVAGDAGLALGAAFSAPTWFFEGDAVYAETHLSQTGRGRCPDFTASFKSLIMANRVPSYRQALLGSYYRYNPNAYDLGYLLTVYLRKHYGYHIFNEILKSSSSYSFYPFAFQKAVKKKTGEPLETHYRDMIEEIKGTIIQETRTLQTTSATPIILQKRNNAFTRYLYPQPYKNGTIIVKTGRGTPPRLVFITSQKKETTLLDLKQPAKFKVHKNRIFIAQPFPHIRFQQESYSDIIELDLIKSKARRITLQGKYFHPQPNPQSGDLLCLTYTEQGKTRITKTTPQKPHHIQTIIESGNMLSNTCWHDQGERFIYLEEKEDTAFIKEYDMSDHSIRTLFVKKGTGISNLVYANNDILFSSPLTGVSAIFKLNAADSVLQLICQSKGGDYLSHYSSNDSTIYFSRGSSNGLFPYQIKPQGKGEPFARKSNYYFKEAPYPAIEKNTLQENSAPEVKSYSPLKNLINAHSRYYYPYSHEHQLGVLSTNIFNTFNAQAGITFNDETQTLAYNGAFTYAGFYPKISIGFETGKKENSFSHSQTGKTMNDNWRENNISVQISLPLTLDGISRYRGLTLFTTIQYREVKGLAPWNMDFYHDHYRWNGILYPFTYGFYYTNTAPMAKMSLLPRRGFYCYGSYSHTPVKNLKYKYNGNKISLLGGFYLPGFVSHDGFEISGSYEHRKFKTYLFAASFSFISGWDRIYFQDFYQSEISYRFPLFYPDLPLSSWIYIKRISGRLFCQYGYGENPEIFRIRTKNYTTCGADLVFNYHILDLPHVEISSGLRFNYLSQDQTFNIQALFFGIRF